MTQANITQQTSHRLNGLHIYCRVYRYTGKRLGLRIAGFWEASLFYKLIYWAETLQSTRKENTR